MGNIDNPLAQLRDIHVPLEPGWWPPAPGWWVLAVGVLVAVWLLGRGAKKRWLRRIPKRIFQRRLAGIFARELPPTVLAAEVSALLKGFLMARYGREKIAALQGPNWLAFLDTTTADGDGFSRGPGAILAATQYQPPTRVADALLERQALYDFLTHWCRQQKYD